MKFSFIILFSFLISACAQNQVMDKKQLGLHAKAEAERIGNSEPLYNHYEACLVNYWKTTLDSGENESFSYDTGVDNCLYELNLLCDYYGNASCFEDARSASRIMFSLMISGYGNNTSTEAVNFQNSKDGSEACSDKSC